MQLFQSLNPTKILYKKYYNNLFIILYLLLAVWTHRLNFEPFFDALLMEYMATRQGFFKDRNLCVVANNTHITCGDLLCT